jgi:CRP/FNR family cyclic AMP-dependent transcriptional regulator
MTTIEALKECGVFGGLNDTELEAVATTIVKREFEPGATIFHEGDRAEEFYILIEGRVALQMSLPSSQATQVRRVTIDIISPTQVFGWSAVVPPHEYTLAAVCLQRAEILAVDGAKLEQVLRSNPQAGYEVMKGFIGVVASRLTDTRHVLVSERSFQ